MKAVRNMIVEHVGARTSAAAFGRLSRHRDGPDEFLIASGYAGTIMADCYSGYQGITLRSEGSVQRGACNSHARRKIFDARSNHPLVASVLLAMYQELYDIEDRGKPLSQEARRELRQQESQPVWARLRAYLDSPVVKNLLPKEAMGKAVAYMNNQWDALQLYLTRGDIPIDNNDAEQLMKQVAVGRKNWLFIGSLAAGERAADLMTLVSSALTVLPQCNGGVTGRFRKPWSLLQDRLE